MRPSQCAETARRKTGPHSFLGANALLPYTGSPSSNRSSGLPRLASSPTRGVRGITETSHRATERQDGKTSDRRQITLPCSDRGLCYHAQKGRTKVLLFKATTRIAGMSGEAGGARPLGSITIGPRN